MLTALEFSQFSKETRERIEKKTEDKSTDVVQARMRNVRQTANFYWKEKARVEKKSEVFVTGIRN